VNRSINQWHDFGSGEKGNIIDLVMKLAHTDSVAEALRTIEQAVSFPQLHSFSFRQQEFFGWNNRPGNKTLKSSGITGIAHKKENSHQHCIQVL
jgi:hypothetical protein